MKGVTMFSKWFSGDNRERYLCCSYKARIDHVGSSLLELRYASDVIRQHLHEWLCFSLHRQKNRISSLHEATADSVRQYLAQRTAGRSASRSRVLSASLRIFLE